MRIAVTKDDFFSMHTDCASHTKLHSCDLEPRRKNETLRDGLCVRVLECAKAGNLALWTLYCLRLPPVTERLPSLGGPS